MQRSLLSLLIVGMLFLAIPMVGHHSISAEFDTSKPISFTGTVKKVVFDIKPHLADQDEQDLHAEMHRGLAAHSLSG